MNIIERTTVLMSNERIQFQFRLTKTTKLTSDIFMAKPVPALTV